MLGWPTSAVISWQYVSFAYLRMNSVDVGGGGVSTVTCGVSEGKCIASSGLRAMSIALTKYTTVSVVRRVSIAKCRSSSSSGVISDPLVVSLEIALAAWCFIPAR